MQKKINHSEINSYFRRYVNYDLSTDKWSCKKTWKKRQPLQSCYCNCQKNSPDFRSRKETELAPWLLRMDDVKFLQKPSLAKLQEDSIIHKVSSRNTHLSFLFWWDGGKGRLISTILWPNRDQFEERILASENIFLPETWKKGLRDDLGRYNSSYPGTVC